MVVWLLNKKFLDIFLLKLFTGAPRRASLGDWPVRTNTAFDIIATANRLFFVTVV